MPGLTDTIEIREQFLNILNLLIAENFNIENGLRRLKNKPVITEPVTILDLEDELDLDWQLSKVALLYGVSGMLYGEEDSSCAVGFLNKYEYQRSLLVRGEEMAIKDVYGGGY